MSKLEVPLGYRPLLSPYETQTAIGTIKRTFEDRLAKALNLRRVSAPLLVDPSTGLNDDLSGVERPVEFDVLATGGYAQVVHSLAKWKRAALFNYGFPVGEGLYTDMNAIRRDEELDNLHSIYVDQWDWEVVIRTEDRSVSTLKYTVEQIVGAVCDTAEQVNARYPCLKIVPSRNIGFVTTQELEDMWPGQTPEEREQAYVKKNPTAFIMQIGWPLHSGVRHGIRAPDYDDWTLNGDLFIWDDQLGCAVELSSMGIRVDAIALDRQLSASGCERRRSLMYHKALLAGTFPAAIGGGIGQSRLCMLLLQKAHVGEVQVSVWDKETVFGCRAAGIPLL